MTVNIKFQLLNRIFRDFPPLLGMGRYQYRYRQYRHIFQYRQYQYRQSKNDVDMPILSSIDNIGRGRYWHIGKNVVSAHPYPLRRLKIRVFPRVQKQPATWKNTGWGIYPSTFSILCLYHATKDKILYVSISPVLLRKFSEIQ